MSIANTVSHDIHASRHYLQVTDQIRQKTGHLPGVAIAVMGCIVNGPGEMADADFGYVGGAPGKIDL
jgi:(E)-4-hydroxy-3-methylbut-2-enyl-diphosphate synthase